MNWCKEGGRSRQDGLEKDHTLWLPLIEGKSRIHTRFHLEHRA